MSKEVAKGRQSNGVAAGRWQLRLAIHPRNGAKFSAKALRLIVAIAVLFLSEAGHTFDCHQDMGHFQHTAWTLSDGAPPDIWALAQSPDGYLWLGTGAGLYRFDGVRFQRVETTDGAPFPSVDITALLAMPSGDIWIGYQNGGVSLLSHGRLTNFKDGVAKGPVHQFAEDQDHTVWMMADYGLARFSDGRWQEIGSDWGFPAQSGNSLFVARDGTLWVTISSGRSFLQDASELVFLRRGSHRFEISDRPVMVAAALAQEPDGQLWVSDPTQGAREMDPIPVAGPSSRQLDAHQPAWAFRPFNLVFDDEGGLWGIHHLGGVFRLQIQPHCQTPTNLRDSGRMEVIDVKDGLTSNISASLLRDREGNIWVGTNLGLDRFGTANVIAAKDIPSAPEGYREAQGPDGSIYVTSRDSLFRIDADGSTTTVFRSPVPVVFLRASRDGATIWLGTQTGLLRFRKGRWMRIALPKAPRSSFVSKMDEDASGGSWIAMWGEGIFHREGGRWSRWKTSPTLPQLAPLLMTTDSAGRRWLYYAGGKLILVDGSKAHTFSAADGPGIGDIQAILTMPGGVLLAGEFGLAAFDGRGFHALRSSAMPPLSRITGIVRTAEGETWLNGIMGLVRMSTRDLDLALAGPGRIGSLSYQLLDFRDGLPGLAQQDSFEPTAIEGSDRRLWFITNHGVAWVDPAHMTRNRLPPPVSIRSVTAGGVQYAYRPQLTIPKHIADLELDYASLSLSIPERVHFRYMLQGADSDWVDPAGRRQAFYTNLPPGRYRFHVIASNNDGVWNTSGASIELFLPPTFVQTKWFTLICGAVGFMLVWVLYSLRLRQIASRLTDRAQARLAERERIARELHDTLLQGFQGLVLRFEAVANRLPPESPGRQAMKDALERADDVIVEGRERVQNLRGLAGNVNLAEIFTVTAQDFVSHSPAVFRVTVSGTARPFHPIVLDEVIKIGRAALFNAFQHANASQIEVAIQYGARRLRVRFGDDGVGFDSEQVEGGDQPHYGLTGMRERARRIHAELEILSQPGRGTQIELTVPGSIAYPAMRRFRSLAMFRRRIGED